MDLNRLTQKSQEALHDAQTKALRFGHTEIDAEHLLLALIEQPEGLVPRLLSATGVDPGKLREQVEAELDRRPRVSGPGAAPGQVFVTQRLSRLFDAAEREAKRLKNEYISVEHLVIAMLQSGQGSTAGRLLSDAGLTLARHATQVRLIILHDDLNRDMSRYLVDQIERLPNVGVLRHTEITELIGDDGRLQALGVRDTWTGERQEIPTTLLFAFIGARPCTGWLASSIALDERGYVLTGAQVRTDAPQSVMLETSRPGVLAVGDVRSGSIKRVASAVGEGSMAVRLIHDHLARFGAAADRQRSRT